MDIKIRTVKYSATMDNGSVIIGDLIAQEKEEIETLTLDEKDPDLQREIRGKAMEAGQFNQRQMAMAAMIHRNNNQPFTILQQVLDAPEDQMP